MGQIVSTRTSRIIDLLEYLKFDRIMAEYLEEDELIPTAELTIPLENNNNILLDRYTIEDLDQLLKNRVFLYINNNSLLFSRDIEEYIDERPCSLIEIKAKLNFYIYQIHPSSHEDGEIILNALLHLIARSNEFFTKYESLSIMTRCHRNSVIANRPLDINHDNFSMFLGKIKNEIEFFNVKMNAEQGTILSSSILQSNVVLSLVNVDFDDDGVSFAQGIANNNGPTKLIISSANEYSEASESTLSLFTNVCNALSNKNNTKLKELKIRFKMNEQAFSSLYNMLKSNIGLSSLTCRNNYAGMKSFWQSLHKHPTLEYVKLEYFTIFAQFPHISKEQSIQNTKPLIKLVKHNLILKELVLNPPGRSAAFYNYQLLRKYVQPRLEINRYRSRIIQIRNEINDTIRSKLLGEFLTNDTIQQNLSLIWMVVRDNHALVLDKFKQIDDDNNNFITEPACKRSKN